MLIRKLLAGKVQDLFVCILMTLSTLGLGCNRADSTTPRIVIFQDKPQEWADALKLGFTEGLIGQGLDIGKDVILIPRSAAGDPITFSNMAETFARGNYVAIYTLGTQASQEVLNRTKDKNIIFGAVTDPVQAGLYKDNLQTPLGNITGTQDLWPYVAQFDLLQSFSPKVSKIGIVYNSSEINSQVSVRYIKAEAKKRNLALEERTVTSESEIQPAVAALLNQTIDMLFIPADNTAQTSSAVIIALCQQKGIPVFTGISGIVERGAIATVGTNYFELGKVNARQA